ncbi:cutinase precursor [Seiridium cupressi]
MKSIVFLALVAATLASPVSIGSVKRQTAGDTVNEFVDGGCRDVIFIFSRGSTESGNMGIIIGPEVANGLKSSLGDADVAAQGVDYAAALGTNFLPGGADPAGIATMVKIYCAVGDLVCDGTLTITAAHLSYGVDAGDATSFLVSLINAA